MRNRRFLSSGALAVLVSLALAGCAAGSSSASGAASPTPTCPATPQQQFTQALGTITAVSSSQMTVQTTKGQVVVDLTSRVRVTEQQTAAQSDVQDGELIQVEVKSNSDGTYSAVVVALTGRQPNGAGGGTGGGTGGGRGGRGGRGTGTPTAQACPGAGRGAGGGAGAGGSNGGTQGGLPSGAKLLTGTVVSILGQTLTVKAANGTVFTVTLESATIYSKIVAGQVSDLKTGQAVRVIGQAQKDGSIDAQAVTILLALPTGQ